MFALRLRKHVEIVLIAVATLALTAGSSSAVVINFDELPNEGGIHVTGDLDVNKANSETFRISAPNCVSIPGCNPDATLSGIGTATEFLVNILESAGGPISDQVWVHRVGAEGGQVIDFISDDESQSSFVTGGPNAVVTTMVETGSLQLALTYTNASTTNPQPVTISVNSELDVTVPEPATLALLGVAIVGIATARRRKPALPALATRAVVEVTSEHAT